MSDGTRLAARLWLPEDAELNPVPAILEYIPYRKTDFTALRDSIRHPYFAGHGYASIRVDMRGSGDSDGILYDEYLPQEQDDALEVLTWIAAQSWCTGDVGIIGKSWGGFNGLQIAARRPPELKAIITLCSTDDRYADDVHYMGGCLLASEMLSWASVMLAYNARPPDPRFVGEPWREMWLARMEETPPFVEAWLQHQRRNAFWQHGSVCENYDDIICPVYAVGGWADGYTNAIFRLLAGLSVPRKGLIGPWVHEYPEVATPGPAIGFLQECLRWWDYWLKGIETDIMKEPMLRAWMQESVPPQTEYALRPGRWVAELAWPSSHIQNQTYWLNAATSDTVAGRLNSQRAPEGTAISFKGFQVHGMDAGVWCAYGNPGDMPADQQEEDGRSISFTSSPLTKPIEILGFPEVSLAVSVDRPLALLAVRLCDVAPDGASTLVSWGQLNLTHQESHENPTPLLPGQQYQIVVRLNAIAHILPAGHRWRVAVSPTYWPHAWPSPEAVTLTLYPGGRLLLPVRPPREDHILPFAPPEAAPLMARETLRSESRRRTATYDPGTGRCLVDDFADEGAQRLLLSGIEYDTVRHNQYAITEGDPLSATAQCDRTIHIGRGAWRTRVETVSKMWVDSETFYVTNKLTAHEGDDQVFQKIWDFSIPRDLV
ncbi:MAG: CocE/NonD family hydrolase [Chloroflexi bacterium]|nr:CocE/NonD family hydrolase [Chloroflexota bacterium]